MGAAYEGPNLDTPLKDYTEKDQHCPLMGSGINYWSILCQHRATMQAHRMTCKGYPNCSGEKQAEIGAVCASRGSGSQKGKTTHG